MEAYETKYKEAKAQMMEAERDKSRALEALQSLVGGQVALKDIVVR
jgi:outer membrane protein TolC